MEANSTVLYTRKKKMRYVQSTHKAWRICFAASDEHKLRYAIRQDPEDKRKTKEKTSVFAVHQGLGKGLLR